MVDIGVNLSTCSYFAATLFCAMALGLRAITPTLIRVMSGQARTCDRLMPARPRTSKRDARMRKDGMFK